MVTDTLPILGHYASTIFDSCSTHFFISVHFVAQVGFKLEPLLHVLYVSTRGVDLVAKDRVKDGQVTVADRTLSIDLIVVSVKDFDVILGMDWLAENHTSIDCIKRK